MKEYWGYAKRGSRIHLTFESRGPSYCGVTIKATGGDGLPPSELAHAFCRTCFTLQARWLSTHLLGAIFEGDSEALEEFARQIRNGAGRW